MKLGHLCVGTSPKHAPRHNSSSLRSTRVVAVGAEPTVMQRVYYRSSHPSLHLFKSLQGTTHPGRRPRQADPCFNRTIDHPSRTRPHHIWTDDPVDRHLHILDRQPNNQTGTSEPTLAGAHHEPLREPHATRLHLYTHWHSCRCVATNRCPSIAGAHAGSLGRNLEFPARPNLVMLVPARPADAALSPDPRVRKTGPRNLGDGRAPRRSRFEPACRVLRREPG